MAWSQRRHPRRATSPALTLDITLSSTIVTHTRAHVVLLRYKNFFRCERKPYSHGASEPGKFIRPRVESRGFEVHAHRHTYSLFKVDDSLLGRQIYLTVPI